MLCYESWAGYRVGGDVLPSHLLHMCWISLAGSPSLTFSCGWKKDKAASNANVTYEGSEILGQCCMVLIIFLPWFGSGVPRSPKYAIKDTQFKKNKKNSTLIDYISPGTPICELTNVGLSTLRSRKRDVRLFFGFIRVFLTPSVWNFKKIVLFKDIPVFGGDNNRINPKKSLTSLFRDLRVESPTWVNSQIGVPGEMYSIKVIFFVGDVTNFNFKLKLKYDDNVNENLRSCSPTLGKHFI